MREQNTPFDWNGGNINSKSYYIKLLGMCLSPVVVRLMVGAPCVPLARAVTLLMMARVRVRPGPRVTNIGSHGPRHGGQRGQAGEHGARHGVH